MAFDNWIEKVAAEVRVSQTGATRNLDTDKFDIEGFFHPEVLHVYAGYMHENRHQRNGSYRDSDNWQLGLPGGKSGILKSLLRHIWDLWRMHRNPALAVPNPDRPGQLFSKPALCCAVMFGAQAYLYELLVEAGMPRGREPKLPEPGSGGSQSHGLPSVAQAYADLKQAVEESVPTLPTSLRPVLLPSGRHACPSIPGEPPHIGHCLTPNECLNGVCRRLRCNPCPNP